MKIVICIFLIIYLIWRQLDRFNSVDYGPKWLNRLMGLNQLVCRKYHKLGDYWLDIPDNQGAIIAANHQSGMDPAVLVAACRRRVRFLATSDYYDLPFVGYILRSAGCIPVYRNKDNNIALQEAIQALKNGEIIGIFPFGGIHLPTLPEPRMRSGVAVLARLAGVKIHPVFISGVAKFSFNKVFTSMFFVCSHLKLTPHSIIEHTGGNDSVVLEQLYLLLSNHLNNSQLVRSGLSSEQV